MSNELNTSEKQAVPTPLALEKARLDAAAASGEARAKARREAAEGNQNSAARSRIDEMGGLKLKLAVGGEVEGHHLYWENDDDGAIENLLYEGFQFVAPAEVKMSSAFVADADLGNRVSRYVGKKADGSPLRAYLLKCPNEIWSERESPRYRQADAWDTAIREGKLQAGDGQHKPKGLKIDLNTKHKGD